MKYFLFTLFFIFSFDLYAQESVFNKGDDFYTEVLHLYLCTEAAPVICPHLGLNRIQAKKRISQLCGCPAGYYCHYRLRPNWEDHKIKHFYCYGH